MKYSQQNIPLILTSSRLLAGLFFLPFIVVTLIPLNYSLLTLGVITLFIALSFTDFLDGYYARKFHTETTLGKLLDPLADKILMVGMLISLLVIGYVPYYIVILLISRELIISGARTIAQEYGISLDVIWLAKIKTALFSLYGVCALWDPYNFFTHALLAGTVIASLVSAIIYIYTLCNHMRLNL
jgi:CDP-diacylglycerol--glycerol-3-phosphate 3-phosphatidyltransferase